MQKHSELQNSRIANECQDLVVALLAPLVNLLGRVRFREVGIQRNRLYAKALSEVSSDLLVALFLVAHNDDILAFCSELLGIAEPDSR